MDEQKWEVIKVLGITPSAYYELTNPETSALVEGVIDKRVASMRETRILATLLRNAHFQGSVSEREFMPLPGDDELRIENAQSAEVLFAALASAFDVTPIILNNEP